MVEYIIIRSGRVCSINPIPSGSLSSVLEKELSYKKQGAEFMPNPMWAWVRLYKVKTGRFPFGLLNKVKSIFEAWVKFNVTDSFKLVESGNEVKTILESEGFKRLSPRLREYQKDSILQLIINNGGILNLPTGAGKTFTAIEYMKYVNKPALVVTTTLDIMEQWKKQIPDFIDVMNYHKINSKNYDMLKKYKVIIFDEVHRCAARTLYDIAIRCNDSIVCGLSATVYREDGEDMKIKAAVGEIVYSIERKKLIEMGYLVDAKVTYVEYHNHTHDKFLSYQDVYKDYIVLNEDRNDKIVYAIKNNLGKKTLVLIHEIEHGEILFKKLEALNIKSRYLHGSVKDRNVLKEDMIIIATGIFDEGVDIPDFEVLILGAGGKSSIKLTQRIGRVLRPTPDKKYCYVYDFVDRSKYLFKHYKRRREILEEDFEVSDE